MQTFTLTKWYLDCVDADGRVAIAYWSAIAWRGIEITWHSISLHENGAEPVHRTSMAPVAAPAVADWGISWQTEPLGCRFDCRPGQPGVGQRLLDTAEGNVDWRCETAAGEMVIACDGRPAWQGFGYAERLEMTLPPWRLPIDQLRWGRWIAAGGDRSVVWINWRGAHPLTAVFVDGQPQQACVVSDERIETGGAALVLTDRQTLYSRSLPDTLGALRPLLAPLLPQSWLAMEDRKWRSRGTLRTAGRPDELGWVIHENVRWPS
jgi:hypothetical protein